MDSLSREKEQSVKQMIQKTHLLAHENSGLQKTVADLSNQQKELEKERSLLSHQNDVLFKENSGLNARLSDLERVSLKSNDSQALESLKRENEELQQVAKENVAFMDLYKQRMSLKVRVFFLKM